MSRRGMRDLAVPNLRGMHGVCRMLVQSLVVKMREVSGGGSRSGSWRSFPLG